ncbi:MAG: carbohydrate ABC transporter permease [Armatimonadota bacterium]
MAVNIPPKQGRRPWWQTDGGWVALLNAPSVLLILALVLYPVGYSFWMSLHRYNLRRPADTAFVGSENYQRILQDPQFWDALRVTLAFAGMSVAGVLLVGLGLALLLNAEFKGRAFLRALLLIPWAIPGVVNGLMWAGILGKNGGVNAVLGALQPTWLGALLPAKQTWLSDAAAALPAAAAAHVWKEVPFATIVFLAALQAIPADQYRAARVDGSTPWRTFRYVTLPWLLHPLLIVAIFQTMGAFRTFDLIYTLTGGGPGRATHVIAWQTYKSAFSFLSFGHANAYAYLIALITLGITVAYIRLLYRRGAVQA